MISGIIGRKVGMTQIFAEDGTVTPVTVIKAGPCVVVQTKALRSGNDGYNAVQLGLVEDKPIRHEERFESLCSGHFEKTGGGTSADPNFEGNSPDGRTGCAIGDQIKVDMFRGRRQDRSRREVERTRFRRNDQASQLCNAGPMSHGSMNVRAPGSIGQSAYPSRVIKGTKSSGHMGDERVTIKGLTVARVDVENNLTNGSRCCSGSRTADVVIVKKS